MKLRRGLKHLLLASFVLFGTVSLPAAIEDRKQDEGEFQFSLRDFACWLSTQLEADLVFNEREMDPRLSVQCEALCSADELLEVMRQSLFFGGLELIEEAEQKFVCPSISNDFPSNNEAWCTYALRDSDDLPLSVEHLRPFYSADAMITNRDEGLIITTAKRAEVIDAKSWIDDMRKFGALDITARNILTNDTEKVPSFCLAVPTAFLPELAHWLSENKSSSSAKRLAKKAGRLVSSKRHHTDGSKRRFVRLSYRSGEELKNSLRQCWPWVCDGEATDVVDEIYWFESSNILLITGTTEECERLEQLVHLFDQPLEDERSMIVFRRQNDLEGIYYQEFEQPSVGGIAFLDQKRYELMSQLVQNRMKSDRLASHRGLSKMFGQPKEAKAEEPLVVVEKEAEVDEVVEVEPKGPKSARRGGFIAFFRNRQDS